MNFRETVTSLNEKQEILEVTVIDGLKAAIEYGVIYKGQPLSSHAPFITYYDIEPVV
jgi:hypothetical protein